MHSSESDVEQKFAFQLLNESPPLGLGFGADSILTKPNTRGLSIGKGGTARIYYPDYVILISTLPVLVGEAKKPGSSLERAYHECRLYASELNALFPTDINPCKNCFVTDGQSIWFGYTDTEQPAHKMECKQLSAGSEDFALVLRTFSATSLNQTALDFRKKLRGKSRYLRPINHVAGGRTEVSFQNPLGEHLVLEYNSVFNPGNTEDRKAVAQYAYVESNQRKSHVHPIDRILQKSVEVMKAAAGNLASLKKPDPLISSLQHSKQYEGQILLLLGSVGSGKSTFVDYLQISALPQSLREDTTWLKIDMNQAPPSANGLEVWIIEHLIVDLQEVADPGKDFDHIDTIQEVLHTEINRFKKGELSLLDPDSNDFRKMLAEHIGLLRRDRPKFLHALIRKYCGERGRALIVVLDNTDKRGSEEQLRMFELANYLRTEFRCLVFLPLRDTTFRKYQATPPLDTVIKDLIFSIDPPLLQHVIRDRLGLIARTLKSQSQHYAFHTRNGMRLTGPRKELHNFLYCLMDSLFADSSIGELFRRLAGRNIRKGLEIFLDLVRSGVIDGDILLKMRTDPKGNRVPRHLLLQALCRGDRKYFQDGHSWVRNLFHADPTDPLPDPFIRLAVLRLFIQTIEGSPTSRIEYLSMDVVLHRLHAMGHDPNLVRREILELIKADCIQLESGELLEPMEDDRIRISPAGIQHLRFLNEPVYLACIAEDLCIADASLSSQIAIDMQGTMVHSPWSPQTVIDNGSAAIEYLEQIKAQRCPLVAGDPEGENYDKLHDLRGSKDSIESFRKSINGYRDYGAVRKAYSPGTSISGTVRAVKDSGYLIKLPHGAAGWLPKASMLDSKSEYTQGELMENLQVAKFDENYKNVLLRENP